MTDEKANYIKLFNSQPHEEADKLDGKLTPEQMIFNSQPHEEADGRSDDWS